MWDHRGGPVDGPVAHRADNHVGAEAEEGEGVVQVGHLIYQRIFAVILYYFAHRQVPVAAAVLDGCVEIL